MSFQGKLRSTAPNHDDAPAIAADIERQLARRGRFRRGATITQSAPFPSVRAATCSFRRRRLPRSAPGRRVCRASSTRSVFQVGRDDDRALQTRQLRHQLTNQPKPMTQLGRPADAARCARVQCDAAERRETGVFKWHIRGHSRHQVPAGYDRLGMAGALAPVRHTIARLADPSRSDAFPSTIPLPSSPAPHTR